MILCGTEPGLGSRQDALPDTSSNVHSNIWPYKQEQCSTVNDHDKSFYETTQTNPTLLLWGRGQSTEDPFLLPAPAFLLPPDSASHGDPGANFPIQKYAGCLCEAPSPPSKDRQSLLTPSF